MEITINKLGRRFNREWIFRNMDYRITAGSCHAVLGPNGSGKSTFIQILAGSLTPSEGTIGYHDGHGAAVEVENLFPALSFAAPYLDLVEEFTLTESIDFHFRFKNYLPGVDAAGVTELLGFEKFASRQIRYFSSGMKQRLKLALAVCSDTSLLLLDEPTANFDEQGIAWYHSLVERLAPGRTVVVCSNQPYEYEFCPDHLRITDFK